MSGGDNVQDTGEGCDDGNLNDGDTCDSNCTIPGCGNLIVDGNLGELCDNGAANSDNGVCTSTCQNAFCGDGLTQTGVEQCDNGVGINSDTTPDACRTSCRSPSCGDDVVDTGEACDLGAANAPGSGFGSGSAPACTIGCNAEPAAVCGNGL